MPRLAIALVWLYQGLWCKLLRRCPGHQAIVQAVPGLAGWTGEIVLAGLGVRRAAAPGAVLVLRSFGEPRNGQAAEWAARDRSPLWGAIEVSEVE